MHRAVADQECVTVSYGLSSQALSQRKPERQASLFGSRMDRSHRPRIYHSTTHTTRPVACCNNLLVMPPKKSFFRPDTPCRPTTMV